MTDLSPAAQEVLDAACTLADLLNREVSQDEMIAAALRALADQVVPQPPMIVEGGWNYEQAWAVTVHEYIRAKIHAIAAELEGSDEPTFTPEEIEMIQAPWSYLQSQQEIKNE